MNSYVRPIHHHAPHCLDVRQPIIVLGYAILAAALLAAALLTESQAMDLVGFLGFLVASAVFAYVFLFRTIWHCPVCFSNGEYHALYALDGRVGEGPVEI
jgi:hypothetical protein